MNDAPAEAPDLSGTLYLPKTWRSSVGNMAYSPIERRLLAMQQGRVPVNPAAANLRAGFIGLKSPRSLHLKHEDFGAAAEKWQQAAAAFAAKVTVLGRRLAAGYFHPDPTPAPEKPHGGACQYCPRFRGRSY